MYSICNPTRAQTTKDKRCPTGHTMSNHNMTQVLHNTGNIHEHSQQVPVTNYNVNSKITAGIEPITS